jgi:hypothetical protein
MAAYDAAWQARWSELAKCKKSTLLGHIRGLDPWNLNPYERWTKEEIISGILRREGLE